MAQTTETSLVIRPEFLRVVDIIYRECCNLQPDTRVLLIADACTPPHVVNTFMGAALAFGAEAMVALNTAPPPPSLQPGVKWNSMVEAASRQADLIVDLSVGYAQFIVDAVLRGARVIMPGDGTGGYHIEESLIRTMLAADIHALRREAGKIADLFTRSSVCRITSEEGTDFEFNIDGLEGEASDGFLWDPDKNEYKSSWEIVPPAQPGITLPKGSGDGVIAVDGFLLYEPAYDHDTPASPVYLTIEKGKLVDVAGYPLFAGRLRHWLNSLPDDLGAYGPVHVNIGTNPRAMMTQHLEFERIRGTIVFGFGDNSLLAPLSNADFATVKSDVHWDVLVMRPTLTLDGRVVVEKGFIPDQLPLD